MSSASFTRLITTGLPFLHLCLFVSVTRCLLMVQFAENSPWAEIGKGVCVGGGGVVCVSVLCSNYA